MRRGTRRIALLYDASRAHDLKVMGGVAAYLHEHHHRHHYSVYLEENALKDQRLPDLLSWRGDGIIADFDDPVIARQVVQARLPAVAFGGGYRGCAERSAIPYFYANDRVVARLAADHLIERGFRHFAYCGYAPTRINGWSQRREQPFVEYVNASGGTCAVLHVRARPSRDWTSVQRQMGEWLRHLPKPVGVMTANDQLGRQILEACQAHELRVPDQVAVIGVDNNELFCLMSTPQLSSVDLGARRLGYAAIALLDEIIQGAAPAEAVHMFDPAGVVTRQSTDVLATADVKVAQALAFIQEHARLGIKVPQVVAAAAISRSGLEKRFASVLGCTIRTAIRRAQLEQTRRLILETDLPLKQIAVEAGFRSVQHMTTLFVRMFGATPARLRRPSPPLASPIAMAAPSAIAEDPWL